MSPELRASHSPYSTESARGSPLPPATRQRYYPDVPQRNLKPFHPSKEAREESSGASIADIACLLMFLEVPDSLLR
jgi:hypothetical protein